MSLELSKQALTQFDNEVKHAYQGGGKLMGTTRRITGVTADTYKFSQMGKGMATERTAPSSDVTPMDITHNRPTCVLTDWEAPEYTDIYNKAEVNIDEVQELAKTISKALERRDDQMKINALVSGTYNATPAEGEGMLIDTNVGGAGTGLNLAKLIAAQERFDDLEVEDTDRYFTISAQGKADLLNDSQLTSADYTTLKALTTGKVENLLGFNFIMIGSRGEGGLPKAGAVRDNFAWDKQAVGQAVGIDFKTRVDWIAHKSSWLSNGIFKAGACIIDNEGVIKIQTTEA